MFDLCHKLGVGTLSSASTLTQQMLRTVKKESCEGRQIDDYFLVFWGAYSQLCLLSFRQSFIPAKDVGFLINVYHNCGGTYYCYPSDQDIYHTRQCEHLGIRAASCNSLLSVWAKWKRTFPTLAFTIIFNIDYEPCK